ncbi:MAG: murein DD-endopeptidase MepM/ murein hydrolase activator NlpD [Kiritimatiellia bacterium]|jgi:murein DD-endopeptidase MepM/ murein hydrolase activator NlpD
MRNWLSTRPAAGLFLASLCCGSAGRQELDHDHTVKPTRACLQLPVGVPAGEGYYVAQGFGKNHHLGEDWNGVGGGNTDLGDPVFSVGGGVVTEASDAGGGWGNVVRVRHAMSTASGVVEFESLYAHLDQVHVRAGQAIDRGRAVGTIGDAHGAYVAHLHLEVRTVVGLPLGPGYSPQTAGYVDPRAWIVAHQQGCDR